MLKKRAVRPVLIVSLKNNIQFPILRHFPINRQMRKENREKKNGRSNVFFFIIINFLGLGEIDKQVYYNIRLQHLPRERRDTVTH